MVKKIKGRETASFKKAVFRPFVIYTISYSMQWPGPLFPLKFLCFYYFFTTFLPSMT